MCPCKEGRIGAFVTVLFLCLALEWWGDLPSMLAQLKAGVPLAIGWAIFAGCGVVLLLDGIRQALSHDDGFDGGSFIWSVGVIGLAFYGLSHHWYLTDGSSVQTSRALWFSWMASNAFNIWLQLRGQLRGLRLPRFPLYRHRNARRAPPCAVAVASRLSRNSRVSASMPMISRACWLALPARPRRDHWRSASLDGPPNYPLGIAAAERLRSDDEAHGVRHPPGDVEALEDYGRERLIIGIDAEPQGARENHGQDQPTECRT